MAPALPVSLSPHIAVLTSPDLDEVLKNASLPPLSHILQSFSPLPQITTRTTTLASVPHASFALRFSDLQEIESACREDDDRRAERMIDWITARIDNRCAKWVNDIEKSGDKDLYRTPWWEELKRCIEGDFVPSKTEGWNHPVAVILAVSTTAPNPLQAITNLHSRSINLPPWVDNNYLKYTLVIHPQDSPLSDEEASALFNAVKKQYGLHTYLLALSLPSTQPPPVPVPALLPRLPLPPTTESSQDQPPPTPMTPNVPGSQTQQSTLNTLSMDEADIHQTARFAREFLLMSLIPWMEKCVMDWSENFSSTRRLPSRLFSSTRRLFGSPAPSPAPSPGPTNVPNRSSTLPVSNGTAPPPQQRRLAEFATILGDHKLAITVWETLRKEYKGGSDILPLLLAPTSVICQYAISALMSIQPTLLDLSPGEQLQALKYAVRWEACIPSRDFVLKEVEGERWLVWAASNAEEATSALLLGEAALLSTKRQAWRRSALWYASAATKLEKCGIKPLTMYFLKKAQELYTIRAPKELSPSFWDSEGKLSTDGDGLEDILSGIEHPLGRLMYTTGDVSGAAKLFLRLLRGSSAFISSAVLADTDGVPNAMSNDKIFLDDFRVAFHYWKSTNPESISTENLELPIKLCDSKRSRVRHSEDHEPPDAEVWTMRHDIWRKFCRSRGEKESVVDGGQISTDELFWMDLVLRNPLDAELNLANLTLSVQAAGSADLDSMPNFMEVEVIKEIVIPPKDSITVPISLKSSQPAKLTITHANYDFLSLLPIKESLSSRGQRLPETVSQRQGTGYAADMFMKVDIVPSDHRLTVSVVEDNQWTMHQGENRVLQLRLNNTGSKPIHEVWMVTGSEDQLSVHGAGGEPTTPFQQTEIIRTDNISGLRLPRRIPLGDTEDSALLASGENVTVPLVLHEETPGRHELSVLFLFRQDSSHPFRFVKLSKSFEVVPLFEIAAKAEPSQSQQQPYEIELDFVNSSLSTTASITDVVSISAQWTCSPLHHGNFLGALTPSQSLRFVLGTNKWEGDNGAAETTDFVVQQFDNFLKGRTQKTPKVPPLDLICSHISKKPPSSMHDPAVQMFMCGARERYSSLGPLSTHSPRSVHPPLPLYHPNSVDFMVFWSIPSQNISGHINIHGIALGAGHAALGSILEEASSAKGKRSMYAETRRQKQAIWDAIRNSDWNAEMNPLTLSLGNDLTRTHDFSVGPCSMPLELSVRNHSLTLPACYHIKFNHKSPVFGVPSLSYSGRLSFRGTLAPNGVAIVTAHAWVTRPGAYSVGGWVLETEVAIPFGESIRKRRYLQESPLDRSKLIISHDAPALDAAV